MVLHQNQTIMENKEITKEYSNEALTIVWKPKRCIHAGECVKALPQVYTPNEKPWIKTKNATTEEIKAQIAKCPSGALSYYMKNEEHKEVTGFETKIKVKPNGPLLVYGTLKITDKDGNTVTRDKTTAFCRCGSSDNKPFCDGSHNKVNFKG